jgi:ornithine carbamoyltransferase
MDFEDLCKGTWQEVLFKRMMAVKHASKSVARNIEKAIEKIEDECNVGDIFDDVEEWIDAFKKKLHIPVWNKLSDHTPSDLKVPVMGYLISIEERIDFYFNATWNSKDKMFYTWDEEQNKSTPEPDVKYWIPLVYPEIW